LELELSGMRGLFSSPRLPVAGGGKQKLPLDGGAKVLPHHIAILADLRQSFRMERRRSAALHITIDHVARLRSLQGTFAVGMPVTGHPPRRSERARFRHSAPTLGGERRSVGRARGAGCAAAGARRQQEAESNPTRRGLAGFAVIESVARGAPLESGTPAEPRNWWAPRGRRRSRPAPALTIAPVPGSANAFVAAIHPSPAGALLACGRRGSSDGSGNARGAICRR